MESLLQEKTESLRFQMIELALANGSLTHESVVMVSQRLDRYILVYQKMNPIYLKERPAASCIL